MDSLINRSLIENVIIREAEWKESHGVVGSYLGSGLLYYTLAYMQKASLAVCLGSGGGFVPRLMRQAQRDLGLTHARTVCVDAAKPEKGWGSPTWANSESFFRKAFPEIEWIQETTIDAARRFRQEGLAIDLLHIDADHSFEGCKQDMEIYTDLLSKDGIVTIHDTARSQVLKDPRIGVPALINDVRNSGEWQVLDFESIGTGVAILKRLI